MSEMARRGTQAVGTQKHAAEMLQSMEGEIMKSLAGHMPPAQFIRTVLTEFQRNPKLLNCSQKSVLLAVMDAASLGLVAGSALGQVYLVPYGSTCTLIPGYQGFIALLYRSGAILNIQARVVREGDEFSWEYGLNEQLVHRPTPDGANRDGVAYYVVVTLPNGAKVFDVMERWEIEAVRAASRAGNDGPWDTHYDEMAKKTVVRRIRKMLPAGGKDLERLDRAIELDNLDYAEAPKGRKVKYAAPTLAPVEAFTEEAPAPEPPKKKKRGRPRKMKTSTPAGPTPPDVDPEWIAQTSAKKPEVLSGPVVEAARPAAGPGSEHATDGDLQNTWMNTLATTTLSEQQKLYEDYRNARCLPGADTHFPISLDAVTDNADLEWLIATVRRMQA
jgi:recombination protein RecT